MADKIERFIKFLFATYPNLRTIVKTFEDCSKYTGPDGPAYLVNDKTAAINFDKLTSWMCETGDSLCKSADALSFNDRFVYLIEFKSGDPTTHERKIQKLIEGVIGKINDSDDTLSALYSRHGLTPENRIPQRFYLVVDSKKMEISPMLKTLVGLSLQGNTNEKHRAILAAVQTNLMVGIKNPDHFDDVDIWYSEIFGTYLNIHNIHDIEIPH